MFKLFAKVAEIIKYCEVVFLNYYKSCHKNISNTFYYNYCKNSTNYKIVEKNTWIINYCKYIFYTVYQKLP